MKVFIALALFLASASALDFGRFGLRQRNIEVPVLDEESRIIGGTTAKDGQFPYQAGLSLDNSYWCGGSIISVNYILTAAHCVDGINNVKVIVGTVNRLSSTAQTRSSTKSLIKIHEGWNSRTLANDIALIYVQTPFQIGGSVGIATLPKISGSYSTYDGQTVIASGWGKTTDTSSVATYLQYGSMKVITNSDCSKTYGTIITSSKVCTATTSGVSTCNGDSGGPLVLNDSAKTQIGLTSFGSSKGCTQGYPVAFTRVTSFLTWIQTNTGIKL